MHSPQRTPRRTRRENPKMWWRRRQRAWREILWPYKAKRHRVIAMPSCLTDLAPPAFTAPCRNQIGDDADPIRKGRTGILLVEIWRFSRKCWVFWESVMKATNEFCRDSYSSVTRQNTTMGPRPTSATDRPTRQSADCGGPDR